MALTGGSLVSNILQKGSNLDERYIDDSIQKLSKKSNQLKGEIYELIKQNYAEFDSYVSSAVSLQQRLQEVTVEYNRLSVRIEQELKGRLLQSTDKRREIELKLAESQRRISFIQALVSVYENLESGRVEILSDKFVSAADLLGKAAVALSEIGSSGCEAKVFRSLKSELAQIVSELTIRLHEEWKLFVSWHPKIVPERPNLGSLLSMEIRLPARNSSSTANLEEVIAAMKLLANGVWEEKIKSFGEKLLRVVITPLVKTSMATNGGGGGGSIAKAASAVERGVQVLKFTECKLEVEATLHSRIFSVYASLATVLGFTSKVVPDSHQQDWMCGLGGVIASSLTDLIVRDCLSVAVPKDAPALQLYSEIASKTTEFEDHLVKVRLIEGNELVLSDYVKNVNTHFVAQKSQDLLVKARSILMKPPHNTVAVSDTNALLGELPELNFPPKSSSESQSSFEEEIAELESAKQESEVDISSFTFAFPACLISESMQEFVQLLYDTLRECCTSESPTTGVQLFSTTRSMVDVARAVLHTQLVSDIPRVAAVQYNSCMYLAHHLITLGHQFHAHLPPPLNAQVATFIDQVPFVRDLGQTFLDKEQKRQFKNIHECFQIGSLRNVSEEEEGAKAVRRGLKQPLFFINKLSRVYGEVLPSEIHRKFVGALLNEISGGIVARVLALEDISSDDSAELHSIIGTVIEKGPQILGRKAEEEEEEEEEKELLLTYCATWRRLEGLHTVLDASLLEIVALWDAGSGPLAQAFSPIELRSLIKALFQNSKHRAEALAKIVV